MKLRQNFKSNLLMLTNEQIKLLKNYCKLVSLECLSEQQEEMLDLVLREAQEDETFWFWLNEANYIIGQKLGLMSEEEIQNQKTLLQEYFVTNTLENGSDSVPLDETFLEKLRDIDFGLIAFKLMHPDDGHGWTLEQVTRGIEQYRRFLMLKYLYPQADIVPTPEVDTVWHCHILDTEKYREDCQKLFDRYLDHFPYLGIRNEADKENLDKAFNQTQSLVIGQKLALMSEEEIQNQKTSLREYFVTKTLDNESDSVPLDETFFEKLRDIDFGPIAFKLMHPNDGPGWTLEQVTRGIEQYRRFLMLKHFYPRADIVPTREVDKVWHCHILDTEKYREDCQKLFDHYLDHFPYLGIRDEADKENLDKAFNKTQALVEELFGAVG